MKTTLFILLSFVSFQILQAQSSPIFDFIKSHSDNPDVTSVFIGPSMAKMIVNSVEDDEDAADLKGLFEDFQGMRILVIENGNGAAIYEEFTKTVNIDGYEELMSVKDGGENVKIIGKPQGDGFSEVAFIVSEHSELVLMSFLGTINSNQIKQLNKAFDLDMDDFMEGDH